MTIVEKIEDGIENLPTLPTIYSSLSEALSNTRTTVDDLAKIISSDQASSFKVLKVVNSPFYGFSGRIDTISRAILYLGFNEIQNIVLALSIINLFSKKKIVHSFRPVDFWAHSIGVGTAARLIGDALGITKLENFFVAGILHDIGKLVFFDQFPAEYEEALKYAENNKITVLDAEKKIIGIGHVFAGELLAAKWKLPLSLRNAIAFHHSGFVNGRLDLLVTAVHLGDVAARSLELGFPGDDFIPRPNPKVDETIVLPNELFAKMKDSLLVSFNETVSLLLVD